MNNPYAPYLGREVVLDTRSSFVFLGRLVSADRWFLVLEDADVHDGTETPSTKEQYILEARKSGVKKNRKKVAVRADQVLSVSLLEDVIAY